MPRPYRLGKRAQAVAETRGRILDAAIRLYQERGVGATSMLEVARQADVAPGTVLNHFRTPHDLASAVAEHLTTVLEPPKPSAIEAAGDLPARIRRLAAELTTFYERSEPWYRVHLRESGDVPAWAAAEARFYQAVDELIRAALGPRALDERAVIVLGTLVSPAVLGGLRSQSLTADEVAELVAELVVPWLGRGDDA